MLRRLRRLPLVLTLLGLGCGDSECQAGCRSEAEFTLESPASADQVRVNLVPGGGEVDCTADGEGMVCNARGNLVNVIFGPNRILEKVIWYDPPVGSTLNVTIEFDGALYAQGSFRYEPSPGPEICGGQCYEKESYSLE